MTSPDDPAQQAAEDMLVGLGNTDIVATSWRADGEGVQPGGDVGGDHSGDAVCVRYLNRYLPHARITTYFYVVDSLARSVTQPAPGITFPFTVEVLVESYLADQPLTSDDAEEEYSDYDYINFGVAFATEAEAVALRDRAAADECTAVYRWDGETGRAVRRPDAR